ncbi:MAG TPA: diaminobutyrate acetyltransferase [Burkholderiales bacterium]|nr:diaminobutyrate acetyltransferase [Burkholderiales bacterium]
MPEKSRPPKRAQEEKRRSAPTLGSPRVADAHAIRSLIAACQPLDLNSTYAYLLLCEHFSTTCVRADAQGDTVGFVSAYRPPRRQETIFVWQVAVHAAARGQGLGGRMLRELLSRPEVRGCRYLETTVSPSNAASMRMFEGLARALDAPLARQAMFQEEDFGAERHESETLLRIGPFAALPAELRAALDEDPHQP